MVLVVRSKSPVLSRWHHDTIGLKIWSAGLHVHARYAIVIVSIAFATSIEKRHQKSPIKVPLKKRERITRCTTTLPKMSCSMSWIIMLLGHLVSENCSTSLIAAFWWELMTSACQISRLLQRIKLTDYIYRPSWWSPTIVYDEYIVSA